MDKGLLAITRRRLLTGAAAGSAALLAGCASGEGAVRAEPDGKKGGLAGAFHTPHLTVGADTARSVTVEWVNPGVDRLELRAAGSGTLLKSIESPARGVTLEGLGFPLHAVQLTGLDPAASYEYRIGESGRWHGFRTASDSAVRALVFTDTQSKDLFKTWKKIYRAAQKQQPGADFSTVLGDLVDMGSKLGYWEDWFAAVRPGAMSQPIAPVMGNHECYRMRPGERHFSRTFPAPYLEFFTVPGNGVPGLERWFYTFDSGPVHFVVLNTQWLDAEDFRPGLLASMKAWFLEKGRKTDRPWTVVLMHKDIMHYPSAKKPGLKVGFSKTGRALMPLFEDSGVDLVLAGHLHTYRRRGHIRNFRRAASGPCYFVCGVAGNLPHDIAAVHKLDIVRGTRPELGNYLLLEADSGRLSVKCFLPDGREFDRAELVKKGGAA